MAHNLPEELSDEESAPVEPVAVGLHAVRQAEFTTGQTAIVFGAGPIGATTVQCLRAAGASMVEVADHRKEMARNIGADVVIYPTQEDVAEAVEKLTGEVGVDAASTWRAPRRRSRPPSTRPRVAARSSTSPSGSRR